MTSYLGILLCPTSCCLFGWALVVTAVDVVDDVVGCTAIDGASDGLSGAQDLLHDSGQLLGLGPGLHHPGGVDDVVHGDVAVVLDVLHLLPVPGGLLEGLDDEGSGGGHHRALGLPVLDTELNSDLETLPVSGGLGDVISNLLGRETKGTDLGGKRGGSSNLASDSSQVDELNLIGVELGSHDAR